MIKRTSLDIYDERPKEMVNYLKYYGWHFNKKMVDFAISKMKKDNQPIVPIQKEKVDLLLKKTNTVLQNNELYDYIYVANMCQADYMGSSIIDELHMAKYIKDTIDDEDGYDGIVFNRWYADMCKKGVPIEWADMI